jgi:hypothetical protein
MHHDMMKQITTMRCMTLFVILTVVDIITTLYIVGNGYPELNPFVASRMEYFIPIKILAVAAIYALARCADRLHDRCGAIVAGVPAIMTVYPVAHNLIFITMM